MSLCLVHVSLSLCVTLSLLRLSVSSWLSEHSHSALPASHSSAALGIIIPFLGCACHLGTEQLLPSGAAVRTKQGHSGMFLELCPPPNKHPEISATPTRRGQLPLRAVLCCGCQGTGASPVGFLAACVVSLAESSFNLVLTVDFWPGAMSSAFLSVTLSGACWLTTVGQENIV